MNKLFLFSLLLITYLSQAQTYTPVDAQSSITFKIKNFGITMDGSVTGLSGDIRFDPRQLSSSKFDVTVEANSIETGIELRNKHLKEENYFDVKTYPQIKFTSTKIETGSENGFIITGKLTIKKTTQEIKFDFSASKQDIGYDFAGEFTLNRRDYHIGGSSFSMADELKVFLSVSCTQN